MKFAKAASVGLLCLIMKLATALDCHTKKSPQIFQMNGDGTDSRFSALTVDANQEFAYILGSQYSILSNIEQAGYSAGTKATAGIVTKYQLSTNEMIWFKNLFIVESGIGKGRAAALSHDEKKLAAVFRGSGLLNVYLTVHRTDTGEPLIPMYKIEAPCSTTDMMTNYLRETQLAFDADGNLWFVWFA
jgi:hypothetical protein